MDFKQWLFKESKNLDIWECSIANADSYSCGSHGFGNEPEVMAPNCYDRVQWNLQYKYLKNIPLVEKLLRDGNALVHVTDSSFQSYHEGQVSFYVSATLRDSNIAKVLEGLSLKDKRGEETFCKLESKWEKDMLGPGLFPFTTFRDAVIKGINLKNRNLSPPSEISTKKNTKNSFEIPRNQESGTEYWHRLMQRADQKAFQNRPLEGD